MHKNERHFMCITVSSFCLENFSTMNVKFSDKSETGFCLGLQVDPTQVGPIERASS
jgi:hypothetical protein